ncbi:hypothetical protein BA060_12175 [Brucella sp. B13-0095]|nr:MULTISPECIES: hypothetical protein [unclassified Brucella]OEI82510.1 hypothetical protein BA060_12175 [Brucella sp. B13-0095]
MVRKINAAGLSLVKQWEGLKNTAYRDVAGVLTIGYLSGFAMLQPLYDKRPISENQRRRPWM